jgi:membrane-associated phospholipid phosphatase
MARPSRPSASAWRRAVAPIERQLPHGWGDFFLQLAIFAVFDIAYELTRSFATGERVTAFHNAYRVVSAERSLHVFHELDVQDWAMRAPGVVLDIANWTYFNCQFTVTILFLLWVYSRRNDSFAFIRNVVLTADFIGIVGYIAFPTAPPRMLSRLGFVDTLEATSVNHHSSLISGLANPYAAMPSLHTTYAVLIGVSGVLLTRHLWAKALWSLYPALVVFSIVATGNHFILDAVAGLAVLILAVALNLLWVFARRRRRPGPPAPRRPGRPPERRLGESHATSAAA